MNFKKMFVAALFMGICLLCPDIYAAKTGTTNGISWTKDSLTGGDKIYTAFIHTANDPGLGLIYNDDDEGDNDAGAILIRDYNDQIDIQIEVSSLGSTGITVEVQGGYGAETSGVIDWGVLATKKFATVTGDIFIHIKDKPQWIRVGITATGTDGTDSIDVQIRAIGGSPAIAGNVKVSQSLSDSIDKRNDGLMIIGSTNSALDIACGSIQGVRHVNKFGAAPSGVQITATDIWDLANSDADQQIIVAPTQARLHDIVSTDAGDDKDSGVGARTVLVRGLTDWVSGEAMEIVELEGTSTATTALEYVLIHRAEVLTKGATSVNVGTIDFTAQTDGTISARILPGIGATNMAFYGIGSSETGYIGHYSGSINKSGGGVATISYELRVNPEPDVELTNFVRKHLDGVQSTGGSHFQHKFNPYLPIPGPAIIKIQGIASAADIDGDAGFDIIVRDNDDGKLLQIFSESGDPLLEEIGGRFVFMN